ncbi:hypothetical protein [Chromobacterium subtsugae]|uniref:hypothetical protein n=1 Tax=Chromobacterium subtsugae TaxID=251747 RepID=UPI000640D19B|nr:hypothetical protein [Chromobacterium subtsugae]
MSLWNSLNRPASAVPEMTAPSAIRHDGQASAAAWRKLAQPEPETRQEPAFAAVPRREPPASTLPDDAPAQEPGEAGLWSGNAAALDPALAQDGGGALAAARLLIAFLLDGAAGGDEPLAVHLPGSHDGNFAWQLWQNLKDETEELGMPPLRFHLYHALPAAADNPYIAELAEQGDWRLEAGDPAPRPGRHAALIAHGHYSRRPTHLAWNQYGEAWRLEMALVDGKPRWRLTPRADYPVEPIPIAVGGDRPQPSLPPLFDDDGLQALAAAQQGRADCGLCALPAALFRDIDALSQAHPDGLLVYLADLAQREAPPQDLPAERDPVLPLNAEALQLRHPALHASWREDGAAAAWGGVLSAEDAAWPLCAMARRAWQADALFGAEAPSLEALARAGHNPRWLVRHLEALEAKTPDPERRQAWRQGLNKAWRRTGEGEAHAFRLGCFALHIGHYGVARHAFLDALEHGRLDAPAWHNLALTEMMTGNRQLAAEALKRLQEAAPEHAKTVKLAERMTEWQARHAPRLGWNPDAAIDEEDGLRLSPLMPHHARELAWACRRPHDQALARLPDLSGADAAWEWIDVGARDENELLLALLHPSAGLLGHVSLRGEGDEANFCIHLAPEWRGRGLARWAAQQLAGQPRATEVWAGNARSWTALTQA